MITSPEQRLKGGAHAALALGKAGALHVGGIGQQGQHPLLAQLAQAGQVGHATLDGGGVDLEVAGVDAHPQGAADGKGHRVGDGVVDVDELHRELARPDGLTRLAGHQLHLVHQAVLLQLQADQSRGHSGGIDGGVDVPHEIGDAPDMVLVAMGDEDGPDPIPILDQIGEVGDDHVDAVHIVVREPHPHVHDDDVAAVLIDGEILADLVQTAQRDDF